MAERRRGPRGANKKIQQVLENPKPPAGLMERVANINGVTAVNRRRGETDAKGNHVPTDESRTLVEIWASIGTRRETIALELGISAATLHRHYPTELSSGKDRSTSRIALSLYEKAICGDNSAMFFWLKTQGRWKEARSGDSEDDPIHLKVGASDDIRDLAAKLRAAKIGGDLYPEGEPVLQDRQLPAPIIDAEFEEEDDGSDLL